MRAASGRQNTKPVLIWIRKVEDPNVTFDQLADSEGYESLDVKLCSAMLDIFEGHGDLLLQLGNLDDGMLQHGNSITGRQVLKFMFAQFVPSAERHAETILNALLKIRAGSIKQLPIFLASWDSLVAQAMLVPNSAVNNELLYGLFLVQEKS